MQAKRRTNRKWGLPPCEGPPCRCPRAWRYSLEPGAEHTAKETKRAPPEKLPLEEHLSSQCNPWLRPGSATKQISLNRLQKRPSYSPINAVRLRACLECPLRQRHTVPSAP